MDDKDNRKRVAGYIKILAASKAVLTNYNSNISAYVTCKKTARIGVLPEHKKQGKKPPKYRGSQSYFVLYNKAGITDRKYKSHRSKDLFGRRYDQEYIKEGPGWRLGNRRNAVKHY